MISLSTPFENDMWFCRHVEAGEIREIPTTSRCYTRKMKKHTWQFLQTDTYINGKHIHGILYIKSLQYAHENAIKSFQVTIKILYFYTIFIYGMRGLSVTVALLSKLIFCNDSLLRKVFSRSERKKKLKTFRLNCRNDIWVEQ